MHVRQVPTPSEHLAQGLNLELMIFQIHLFKLYASLSCFNLLVAWWFGGALVARLVVCRLLNFTISIPHNVRPGISISLLLAQVVRASFRSGCKYFMEYD